MRPNLKQARLDKGMTQQRVADHLGISLRYYQMLEAGRFNGRFELWDALEDLFQVHQRVLRVMQDNHHDQAANQSAPQKDRQCSQVLPVAEQFDLVRSSDRSAE